MVLRTENMVGSAGNPAIGLTLVCEALFRRRVPGASGYGGNGLDTEGEAGAEARWEGGQW